MRGRQYGLAPVAVNLRGDFARLRAALDDDITEWARTIRDDDLRGDLTWVAGIAKR